MSAIRTEEQDQLAELISTWAREVAAPRAAQDEARAELPRDLFDELGRLDLAGLPFDEELGGGGQTYGTYLEVLEEIARAHVVVALTLSVHTLSTWILLTYGTTEVRESWGRRACLGQALGAYSLSEPGSGSDAAALVTRADRDGDSYVLSGTKAWVSHAPQADFFVVMARTGEHKSRGISAFLVPAGAEGLEVAAPERKMGMAASPTCQLLLDDVRVPASHLLGQEGQGFRIALAGLDGGRLGIAACATGLAQAALDAATGYAREREQFGRSIAEFQGVSFLLADMATGIGAARALYRAAAARRDAGLPHVRDASMAKLFATDTAMTVTTDAVQVFGGYGYTREFPVERFMREAKGHADLRGHQPDPAGRDRARPARGALSVVPDFTCRSCGSSFSLPQDVLDRYPGWTPAQCRSCRDGASAPKRSGGRRRPASQREENLTLDEVLARYTDGPHDGLFTDGSADPNPGPGGWGAVYVVGGEVVDREHGSEEHTTNNRMELQAVIAGYDLVPLGTPAVIHSDSRYVVDTINKWAEGWERRGWKRKGGPVENLDLVKELWRLKQTRPEIEVRWLPGHSGARWNEYADSLSTAYRRRNL